MDLKLFISDWNNTVETCLMKQFKTLLELRLTFNPAVKLVYHSDRMRAVCLFCFSLGVLIHGFHILSCRVHIFGVRKRKTVNITLKKPQGEIPISNIPFYNYLFFFEVS